MGYEEKPNDPKAIFNKPSRSLVNMGVYVFNTQTLMGVLSDDARESTSHDFGKNIIPRLVGSERVAVYYFSEMGTRLDSYWRDVGTLDAYYRVNMELLLTSFLDPYAVWPLYGLSEHHRPKFGQADPHSAGIVLDSVIPQDVSIAPRSRVIHSVLRPACTSRARLKFTTRS